MRELKNGMSFKNFKELCEFTGIKFDLHTNYLKSKIKQICDFHNEGRMVIIDNVFGNISDIQYLNKNYLYKINDIVSNKYGEIKILECTRIVEVNSKTKAYKYICLNDKYEGIIRESHIKQGVGCPICSNRKCSYGINSIADTRPDLIKYIANKEDTKKYTSNSGIKVLCKCPECGYKKSILINNLSRFGFSCNFCSDKISYPNKFIYNILKQLHIEFFPEQSFYWSNGKIYDIYIKDNKTLIENHGIQHYEYGYFNKLSNITLKEEQENDKLKEQLAKENGIKHYIVLDCRKSELEWIKKSVMNSELSTIFNFSEDDIDWLQCHEFANKSIIKEVCEFWMNNNKNISFVSETYNFDPHTVIDYLKRGSICGYCDYTKGCQNSKSVATKNKFSKPLFNIDYKIYFFSRHECEDYFKSIGFNFVGRNLYQYINKGKTYHGLTFNYVTKTEYNNAKKLYLESNNNPIVIGDFYDKRYIEEDN